MNIYESAIKEFGVKPQVDMLIEEMSELTQALLKWRRGKDVMDNVHEEIADVEIMLAQIKTGLSLKKIEQHKKYKLERLENLLTLHRLKNG
jgi:NTP pyrophosphatase (non-canonical NTP hydrolase)